MANTFLSLQQRVQTRLIDVRQAVTDEIPELINEAIDALQAVHNWRCMSAQQQFITNHNAANPRLLGTLPTSSLTTWRWKEPKGDPFYVMQIGDTRQMIWMPNREFAYRQWSANNPYDIGAPRMLLVGEASNPQIPDPANADGLMTSLNIEVYPAPDGMSDWNTAPGGEYRIWVPYWGFLPSLSADGDTNWFTENATRYIIDAATASGFQLDWDESRANYWATSAFGPKWDGANMNTLGGWARVAFNKDKSIAFAPGRTLTPRRDVYASPWQWRT